MLMSPTSRQGAPHRLIAIPKKRLPKVRLPDNFTASTQGHDKQNMSAQRADAWLLKV
jgi:hypothetical protein